MKGVVFFAYLCLLLLGSYDYAHAGIVHEKESSCSARYFPKTSQDKFNDVIGDYAIIENSLPNNEKEYFIDEEDDDEDSNDFAKKHRSLSRCPSTFYSLSVLNQLHNSSKAPQPFYSWLSDKYLTLRVLRI